MRKENFHEPIATESRRAGAASHPVAAALCASAGDGHQNGEEDGGGGSEEIRFDEAAFRKRQSCHAGCSGDSATTPDSIDRPTAGAADQDESGLSDGDYGI